MVTTLYAGKFLALLREGHWEYAHRPNASGAAIIVAITTARSILLVEQYRIPLHARTIELPAGIVGDEPGRGGEEHRDAAQRELLEETGYACEAMQVLTRGPASAGLTYEVVTFFLATGLQKAGAGGGVGHEAITVHEVALATAHDWLADKARAEVLIDPKVYAGLYFAERHLKRTFGGATE